METYSYTCTYGQRKMYKPSHREHQIRNPNEAFEFKMTSLSAQWSDLDCDAVVLGEYYHYILAIGISHCTCYYCIVRHNCMYSGTACS